MRAIVSVAGSLWSYLKDKDIHLCPTFNSIARQIGECFSCGGESPIEPQYSYKMNTYLNGDGMGGIPQEYRMSGTSKELGVKHSANVFLFSEENTWTIQGMSGAPFNDNNLRAYPSGSYNDIFATFHNAPARNLDKGSSNAVFVDGHVDNVSPYPAGNTFKLSWPGGSPIPYF